ncbi:hypothetical protein [Streptomyces sp. PSAA01]|uniref:hypothetical protein n=1 Tax=Streptomyces sp. PSAA01 TaxID=2912762 RepID=UPI001F268357|nr:hypothetical protein [Streptomyces sp. PSAA01]MCG0290925.1 hypothetical protein [Streptomyces sp. PSAA01]
MRIVGLTVARTTSGRGEPKGGAYHVESAIDFGVPVDLTGTVVDLTLATDEFPRD